MCWKQLQCAAICGVAQVSDSLQLHSCEERWRKRVSCGENRTKKSKNSAGFVFKDVPDLILRASIPILPFQNGSCCGSCFAVISVIGYHVLSLSEVQRKVSCANNLRFNVEQFPHLKMCSFFVLNWYQLQRQQRPTHCDNWKPLKNQLKTNGFR